MSDSPADDTLPGYFIAPDFDGDVWIWRENGSQPQPIISQHDLSDDALWGILAAAIRTVDA